MRLKSEFIKLPFLFDHEYLAKEIAQIEKSEWMPHPSNLAGNFSLPLISAFGEKNDLMSGEMKTTQYLEKLPYVQQILSSIGEIYGRSRLMLLKAGCQVIPHYDLHYHWYNRVRIHIPIITNAGVIFRCDDKSIHMEAGETWIFDSWRKHSVSNNSNYDRVHLVIDTCGSAKFWNLVEGCLASGESIASNKIPFNSHAISNIKTEKHNTQSVMSPGEVDYFANLLIDDAIAYSNNSPSDLKEFVNTLNAFRRDWRDTWLLYGNSENSWPHYKELITKYYIEDRGLKLFSNECGAQPAYYALLLGIALDQQDEPSRSFGKKLNKTQKTEGANSFGNTRSIRSRSSLNKLPSRNSLCVCGSQLKYKYCCGKMDN